MLWGSFAGCRTGASTRLDVEGGGPNSGGIRVPQQPAELDDPRWRRDHVSGANYNADLGRQRRHPML